MTIIKLLSKKPKIHGVSNFVFWSVATQIIGKMDGKNGQLSEMDGVYSTPWIEKKHSYLSAYKSSVFLAINKELEAIYKEIHTKNIELKLISDHKEDHLYADGAEGLRQAAAYANQSKTAEERQEQLLLRLAEIKGIVEAVEAAVIHNLERSENILHSHISTYWKGIVRSSACQLPSYPGKPILEVKAKEDYDRHLTEIKSIFNLLLS